MNQWVVLVGSVARCSTIHYSYRFSENIVTISLPIRRVSLAGAPLA